MKTHTKLLVQILLFFLITTGNAQQCTEPVTNFGNNLNVPNYNISGDVEVIYDDSNQTVTLILASNYSTANGPDVRAYLVNSNGASTNDLRNSRISDLEHIEFGLTQPSGADSFTIAAPSNIEDFDTIFFYCFNFNAFWDLGYYTAFTPANCSVLSIDEALFNQNITIFPNPAYEKLEIRNDLNTAISISIYNVLGKEVQFKKATSIKNQTISLSNLNSGVYLVEIKSDQQKILKKLIKR